MMRRAVVVLGALIAVSCGGREVRKVGTGVEAGPEAVFDISPEILASHRADTLVDIGHVTEGEVVQFEALLRNAGTEPLVVTGVETSCGCTKVEYEKSPVEAGETGEFSFRFDSRGFWGTQLKLIEIHTSASQRPYRMLVRSEVDNPEIDYDFSE